MHAIETQKAALAAALEPALASEDALQRALRAVRTHLGMEFAYISEIIGDHSFFRAIDTAGDYSPVKTGDSMPLDQMYCPKILTGELPELIVDTNDEPLTQHLAITKTLPIRSHVSVPLKLSDGRTFGMFCCLNPTPVPDLNPRDLDIIRAFAEMTVIQIRRELEATDRRQQSSVRVDRLFEPGVLRPVYQPIVKVETGRVAGFECLTRFRTEEGWTPDIWFAEAARAGRGVELEVLAIRTALSAFSLFPTTTFLSINASPSAIRSGLIEQAIDDLPFERIILEITEHDAIADYAEVRRDLAALRKRGLRIAIDDAGAGYAGLRHMVDLEPDFIKLDMSITRDIDSDPGRRALAAALASFCLERGSKLVAEGVETEAELQTLRKLRVDKLQGYLLGRPVPLEQALELAHTLRLVADNTPVVSAA